MFLFDPQWWFAPILTKASSRMLETLVAGKGGLVVMERWGGFEHFRRCEKKQNLPDQKGYILRN